MCKEETRPACGADAALRPARWPRWTRTLKAAFLVELRHCCDVAAASARIGVDAGAVHALRRRDADFDAAWHAAIADGYAELEWRLLATALDGVTRTETVRDAKADVVTQVKTVHSHDVTIGLRLLLAHRAEAAAAKANDADRAAEAARDADAALGLQLRMKMDEIRQRLVGPMKVAGIACDDGKRDER